MVLRVPIVRVVRVVRVVRIVLTAPVLAPSAEINVEFIVEARLESLEDISTEIVIGIGVAAVLHVPEKRLAA